MTDKEISAYLTEHKYAVKAQDGIMDILNTSPQIIGYNYEFESRLISITTPDNLFQFKWLLNEIS